MVCVHLNAFLLVKQIYYFISFAATELIMLMRFTGGYEKTTRKISQTMQII